MENPLPRGLSFKVSPTQTRNKKHSRRYKDNHCHISCFPHLIPLKSRKCKMAANSELGALDKEYYTPVGMALERASSLHRDSAASIPASMYLQLRRKFSPTGDPCCKKDMSSRSFGFLALSSQVAVSRKRIFFLTLWPSAVGGSTRFTVRLKSSTCASSVNWYPGTIANLPFRQPFHRTQDGTDRILISRNVNSILMPYDWPKRILIAGNTEEQKV